MDTVRKNKGFEWFWWLLLAIVLIAVSSCGAKNKTLGIVKSDTKIDKDLTVFEQNNVRLVIDKKSNKLTYKFTPIDINQPIRLPDSTEVKNAVVEITVEQEDVKTEFQDTSTKEITDKGSESVKKSEKHLNVEKEGFSWNGLKWALIWIVVVIVAGGIVYLRATGRRIGLPRIRPFS